tara:strand:- start:7 stop:177 length:171 start_codon:yes stop_codon:yes gene_type:complete
MLLLPLEVSDLRFASKLLIKILACSLGDTDYQEENYLNKSDTDIELDILFIASPTN